MIQRSSISIVFSIVAVCLIGLIVGVPLLDSRHSLSDSGLVQELQVGVDSDSEDIRAEFDHVGLDSSFSVCDYLFQPKFIGLLSFDFLAIESVLIVSNGQRGPPSPTSCC